MHLCSVTLLQEIHNGGVYNINVSLTVSCQRKWTNAWIISEKSVSVHVNCFTWFSSLHIKTNLPHNEAIHHSKCPSVHRFEEHHIQLLIASIVFHPVLIQSNLIINNYNIWSSFQSNLIINKCNNWSYWAIHHSYPPPSVHRFEVHHIQLLIAN